MKKEPKEKKLTEPDETKNLVNVDKTCTKCVTHHKTVEERHIDGRNSWGIWFTCKAIDPTNNQVCGSTLLILSPEQRKLLIKHGRLKENT